MMQLPCSVPEAERLAAIVVNRICRHVHHKLYTEGGITRARVGIGANAQVVRCRLFGPDGWEYGQAQLQIVKDETVLLWIDLVWTIAEGWTLPHE